MPCFLLPLDATLAEFHMSDEAPSLPGSRWCVLAVAELIAVRADPENDAGGHTRGDRKQQSRSWEYMESRLKALGIKINVSGSPKHSYRNFADKCWPIIKALLHKKISSRMGQKGYLLKCIRDKRLELGAKPFGRSRKSIDRARPHSFPGRCHGLGCVAGILEPRKHGVPTSGLFDAISTLLKGDDGAMPRSRTALVKALEAKVLDPICELYLGEKHTVAALDTIHGSRQAVGRALKKLKKAQGCSEDWREAPERP